MHISNSLQQKQNLLNEWHSLNLVCLVAQSLVQRRFLIQVRPVCRGGVTSVVCNGVWEALGRQRQTLIAQ